MEPAEVNRTADDVTKEASSSKDPSNTNDHINSNGLTDSDNHMIGVSSSSSDDVETSRKLQRETDCVAEVYQRETDNVAAVYQRETERVAAAYQPIESTRLSGVTPESVIVPSWQQQYDMYRPFHDEMRRREKELAEYNARQLAERSLLVQRSMLEMTIQAAIRQQFEQQIGDKAQIAPACNVHNESAVPQKAGNDALPDSERNARGVNDVRTVPQEAWRQNLLHTGITHTHQQQAQDIAAEIAARNEVHAQRKLQEASKQSEQKLPKNDTPSDAKRNSHTKDDVRKALQEAQRQEDCYAAYLQRYYQMQTNAILIAELNARFAYQSQMNGQVDWTPGMLRPARSGAHASASRNTHNLVDVPTAHPNGRWQEDNNAHLNAVSYAPNRQRKKRVAKRPNTQGQKSNDTQFTIDSSSNVKVQRSENSPSQRAPLQIYHNVESAARNESCVPMLRADSVRQAVIKHTEYNSDEVRAHFQAQLKSLRKEVERETELQKTNNAGQNVSNKTEVPTALQNSIAQGDKSQAQKQAPMEADKRDNYEAEAHRRLQRVEMQANSSQNDVFNVTGLFMKQVEPKRQGAQGRAEKYAHPEFERNARIEAERYERFQAERLKTHQESATQSALQASVNHQWMQRHQGIPPIPILHDITNQKLPHMRHKINQKYYPMFHDVPNQYPAPLLQLAPNSVNPATLPWPHTLTDWHQRNNQVGAPQPPSTEPFRAKRGRPKKPDNDVNFFAPSLRSYSPVTWQLPHSLLGAPVGAGCPEPEEEPKAKRSAVRSRQSPTETKVSNPVNQ